MPRVAAVVLCAVVVLSGCAAEAPVEVSGAAPAERVSAYEEMGEVALEEVERVWGSDSVATPARVLLPATTDEFAELTGGAPASQGAPAATVGSGQDARVVVHPDSWDRLTPQGRQAVLTHEFTHLTMQGDGPVPAWLGEGLAEYTAHRESDLPPQSLAGPALDEERDGALPQPRPDLATTTDNAWGGYALSWLACLYLAETWSQEELLELYREVSGGTPLEDAFPQVLGVSEAEVLEGWSAWLTDLVEGPSLR